MGLYYYKQLNAYEQAVYWTLERGIAEFLPEILLDDLRLPIKRVKEISQMITMDYPEYYWSKGSFDSFEKSNGTVLKFSYLLPKADREEVDSLIFQRMMQMELNNAMSIEEKVNAVYDWIKQNVKYDANKKSIDRRENQTIYSVFIEGRSLCMGISKAFDLAMRLSNVNSFVALGNVFGDNSVGHAWNMVLYNGNYLQVDVTMGYPEFKALWKKYQGDKSSRCALVPFEYISDSHVLNDQFKYPATEKDDFGNEEVWL